jgi:hypothetical protein
MKSSYIENVYIYIYMCVYIYIYIYISATPDFTKLPLSDLQFFLCRNKDKEILVVFPKSREQLQYYHVGNACCTYGVYKMQSVVTDIPYLNKAVSKSSDDLTTMLNKLHSP